MQPPIGAFDIMAILLLKGVTVQFNLDVFLRTMDSDPSSVVWEFRKGRDWRRVGCSVGDRFDEVAKMQTWGSGKEQGIGDLHLCCRWAKHITRKDLFFNYQEPEIKESTIDTVFFLSKTCLALLLIGHAGFGFAVEKQMLINHWLSIGWMQISALLPKLIWRVCFRSSHFSGSWNRSF